MRMIDVDRKRSVHALQPYLTPAEAKELSDGLVRLLKRPEVREHGHVAAGDGLRDLSVSIVTPAKLADLSGYTEAERRLLQEE